MTTENLLSANLTNRDATPRVLNSAYLDDGMSRESIGSVTTTASVTTGSTYRLVSVPSNARISQILLNCGALSTSVTGDIGVYRSTADGGAVVDADFFASAVDMSSALKHTDVTNESGTNTPAKQEQQLWQAVGLTTDPKSTLDIVVTSGATMTASGAIQLKVRYVV